MSCSELKLVTMLAEKIGITTLGELDEFKKITKVTTNEMLVKRLALYVASGTSYAEVLEYKRIHDQG